MAAPITNIRKKVLTEQEQQQQVIDQLQKQLSESNAALERSLSILRELESSGILGAAESMIKAKAEIAEIVLGQVSRKEITNLINNGMAAAGALTAVDPAQTSQLMSSVQEGLKEAAKPSTEKVGLLSMLRAMKDPDIQRALGFGLRFLKGLGHGLKNDSSKH
ncbi:DUF1641 domain-containing protein [Paenibacillus sp. WLX2291]|uniref:DUF1641 domain-containing protein n=1 Tax=Paenibacillus sp. WLX2291 TaxID=3296934 RepID=UPI003984423B